MSDKKNERIDTFTDEEVVDPFPFTDDNPLGGISDTACINNYFEFSVSLSPTDQFPLTGADIANIQLPLTGAIDGLPTGMQYNCNPPDCIIPSDTVGCILIYGTPTDPENIGANGKPTRTADKKRASTQNFRLTTWLRYIAETLDFGNMTLSPPRHHNQLRIRRQMQKSSTDLPPKSWVGFSHSTISQTTKHVQLRTRGFSRKASGKLHCSKGITSLLRKHCEDLLTILSDN